MFSLPKILLLGLIIVVVLYGFKWVARMQEQRVVRQKKNDKATTSTRDSVKDGVEDTSQCSTCGAYVTSGARNCGRDNCPFTG